MNTTELEHIAQELDEFLSDQKNFLSYTGDEPMDYVYGKNSDINRLEIYQTITLEQPRKFIKSYRIIIYVNIDGTISIRYREDNTSIWETTIENFINNHDQFLKELITNCNNI